MSLDAVSYAWNKETGRVGKKVKENWIYVIDTRTGEPLECGSAEEASNVLTNMLKKFE